MAILLSDPKVSAVSVRESGDPLVRFVAPFDVAPHVAGAIGEVAA